MFIQTEETPNPTTLKFLPGKPVSTVGTFEFLSAEQACSSPLASNIFAVDGVKAVFLGGDFIAVTREADYNWDELKIFILAAVSVFYDSGKPVIQDDNLSREQCSGHEDHTGDNADIVSRIKELLDTRVRPAVAQDGGDITFHGFDNGVVYLHMRGACAGCPSSSVTLKMGIENLLKYYIPSVTEVRPVL